MAYLASTIMDGVASVFLNDPLKDVYTYAKQLPLLKRANRDLEQLLIINGSPVQRQVSATLTVTAGARTINPLPTDFLLPEFLSERAVGESDRDWVPITESAWDPIAYTPTNMLGMWAFRDNNIHFPAATTNREVLLQYQRQLAVIVSENSPEDVLLAQNYLEARTAELCARHIGFNSSVADGIAVRDVVPSQDALERILILNQQGNRGRRRGFNTRPVTYRSR